VPINTYYYNTDGSIIKEGYKKKQIGNHLYAKQNARNPEISEVEAGALPR
jgi:hypothetical protein